MRCTNWKDSRTNRADGKVIFFCTGKILLNGFYVTLTHEKWHKNINFTEETLVAMNAANDETGITAEIPIANIEQLVENRFLRQNQCEV